LSHKPKCRKSQPSQEPRDQDRRQLWPCRSLGSAAQQQFVNKIVAQIKRINKPRTSPDARGHRSGPRPPLGYIRWPSGCHDSRISCDKARLIIGIISVVWPPPLPWHFNSRPAFAESWNFVLCQLMWPPPCDSNGPRNGPSSALKNIQFGLFKKYLFQAGSQCLEWKVSLPV